MTRAQFLLRASAAIAAALFLSDCSQSKGLGVVQQANPIFFNSQSAIEPPPPTDREAQIRQIGEQAGALASDEGESLEVRIQLALVSGLSHYWFGEWGEAAGPFQSASQLCDTEDRPRVTDRPCDLARIYGTRNVARSVLSGTELGAPRGTPENAELDASQWQSLAATAARYSDAVFENQAPVTNGAQTADLDNSMRVRNLCSFISAYNRLPSWRAVEGAAAAKDAAFAEIRLTAVPGLQSIGHPLPRECSAAQDSNCSLEAWTGARNVCRTVPVDGS